MPLNSYRQGEENLKNANFMANKQEQAKDCVRVSIKGLTVLVKKTCEATWSPGNIGKYQEPWYSENWDVYIFNSEDRNSLGKKIILFAIF